MIIIAEPRSNEITFRVFRSFESESPALQLIRSIEDCTNKSTLKEILNNITEDKMPQAISVRILFGGESFDKITLVDEILFTKLKKLIPVRPYYITGVLKFLRVVYDLFPDVPIIGFFETAFFSALPEAEKCYAIPEDYFQNTTFRKWGFHGIWHYYNSHVPENPDKTISIVLGKTTTVCALNRMSPVTVSYGGTPLEGIMGEKSCGDIDPGIVLYLIKKLGCSIYKMDEILKMKSGFYGLTGYNKGMNELIKLLGNDKKVEAAFEIYMNQVKKYIGESCALLGGITDVVFSGEYVEVLNPIIYKILKDISFLDVGLMPLQWEAKEKLSRVTSNSSKISVYINRLSLYEIINGLTRDFIATCREIYV